MIDISKTDKELSASAKYAIQWFEQNGFLGRLTIHNVNKDEFVVSKDGIEDIFTLTISKQDPRKCNIQKYMEEFNRSFEMKLEIERLKKELQSRNE